MRGLLAGGLCWLCAGALLAQASDAPTPAAAPQSEAPSWLRSANPNVEAGNLAFGRGEFERALALYDAAARELPSEGGVHLNRGLALLARDELAKAREALLLATQPPGEVGVRADAYYDLAGAFYREADAAAGQDDHEAAQKLFREAVDALERSLRLRPGNRDAAWNLELALRRLREQEQKEQEQKEQEQKEQEQKEQEQKEQEQGQDEDQNQDQDQDQDQDQNQDPQDQDPQEQDPQQQDPQDQDPQKQDQEPQPQDAEEPEALPSDVTRALDALQAGEENLEKLQARQRAMRERRAPAEDW